MKGLVSGLFLVLSFASLAANAQSGSKDLYKAVEAINAVTAQGAKNGGSDCASGKCGTVLSNVTFQSNYAGTGISAINFTSLFNEQTSTKKAGLVTKLVDLLKSKGYVFKREGPDEFGVYTYSGPTLPAIDCSMNRNAEGVDEYNCDITQRLGVE